MSASQGALLIAFNISALHSLQYIIFPFTLKRELAYANPRLMLLLLFLLVVSETISLF
jgi:hypothetical protein